MKTVTVGQFKVTFFDDQPGQPIIVERWMAETCVRGHYRAPYWRKVNQYQGDSRTWRKAVEAARAKLQAI